MQEITVADDQADAPRCASCHTLLRDTERRVDGTPYQGCDRCRRRVDADLAALAGQPTYVDDEIVSGLYAALGDRLMPGRSGDGIRGCGGAGSRMPLNLEPLSLQARGGVVTMLQLWARDWDDTLRDLEPWWKGSLQEQLDATVRELRRHLLWAAAAHPAWTEFAGEVREVTGACRLLVTGERFERPIMVRCTADGCDGVMPVTVSTDGVRCRACGTRYSRTEALGLPVAARSATAA